MDRRTFLAGSLLGAASLTLAGCAGTLPRIDSSSASFRAPATGTINVWCRSATQAGLVSLVADFNASNSGLRVELTPIPDAQYVTKLATAIRGGEPPDVVDIDDINSSLFIFRDVFADLTSVVTELPYFDSLSTGHMGLLKNDDKIYGLPYLADNSMLFYNTELLANAGVDPASLSTGFDGLLAAAKSVQDLGDDVFGWTLSGNAAGILGFTVQPHIWATGSDMQKGEIGQQQGNIIGNDALEQTLDFYRQLWTDGLVSRNAYSDGGQTWGADFRAGTVGLMPVSYGAIAAATPEMLAKIGTVLLPGPTGGAAFFDGGDNMCIPNGARNAAGGWEFMKFATSVETQAELPAGGYFPIRSDVLTPEYAAKYPLSVLPLENIDRGYAPQTLSYNQLYNQPSSPFFSMFREAVFGAGVTQAMRAAQPAWDRILDQAQA